jgi:hypothetical protein
VQNFGVMLAYVFWHTRSAATDARAYEEQLLRFHELLRAARIDGFLASSCARVFGLPWTPANDVYEDWYVLSDSAVLDRINGAAVAQAATPHDQLALASDWGAGGLYRHALGQLDLTADQAFWFAKPRGMTYAQLNSLVTASALRTTCLWQRQMVLGPAPEYCLMPVEAHDLALLSKDLAGIRTARIPLPPPRERNTSADRQQPSHGISKSR